MYGRCTFRAHPNNIPPSASFFVTIFDKFIPKFMSVVFDCDIFSNTIYSKTTFAHHAEMWSVRQTAATLTWRAVHFYLLWKLLQTHIWLDSNSAIRWRAQIKQNGLYSHFYSAFNWNTISSADSDVFVDFFLSFVVRIINMRCDYLISGVLLRTENNNKQSSGVPSCHPIAFSQTWVRIVHSIKTAWH